jgi:hypothetical protein
MSAAERNGNGRGTFSLNGARELTPPVNPVEAMRRQLALGVFGAVKEKDVTDLVSKLHAMAMEGDHKAMKMYFELVGVMGKNQQPPAPPAEGAGLKMMAEALQDLVDEIRISKVQAQHEYAAIQNGDGE